ncbi:putative 2-oxoglutarate dehydrogenase E1 component DHKTD1, mitochondrial [Hypsizygus marmoreus]|uniref:2-oxoglutarate dehydrogenase E1 component DHKTD1, mitochondrial n=1 Tax=Hypsizygus marmoreus TaxID=39966 RepID=A0A369K7V4_HYPMA|nr:putative 2-oxoglutarate dehydrogenase E1 component DHKTD1, mitochondrial [Hypsizygus marmoreus]
MLPLRSRISSRVLWTRRYHDESFGFRKPREYVFPDYTEAQLENRYINAPLLRYVDSMRTHGHRAARIDPLDIIQREEVAALDPGRYGLNGDDKKYNVNGIIWTKPVGGNNSSEEWWTLGEITRHLRSIYVGRIAHEFMHSPSKTERLWFSHLLESDSLPTSEERPIISADKELKRRIHGLLARSEVLDHFLQLKFPNLKRYGLEGGESMIPALDSLFSAASHGGIKHIILGMPHRGRLNLLTDLLQYSPTAMFNKIKGGYELPEELGAEGDVLSHLVSSPSLDYNSPNPLKVSLLPNPSHLEAVNPVALGKTRAKQYSLLKTSPDDCELGDKVMCIQLHGDASFTGQGVIMEGLGLSNLPHFTSGGTVHLVVDNNIGYTTPASNARSSLYCSDVGKMINAPVLHVNGDYPEDVVRAMDIAFRYRKYFRKDIIVDLLVYRRCHNELDLPGITSPLMYEKISARRSVPQLYEEKLKSEEILTENDISNVRGAYKSHLEAELAKVGTYTPTASMLEGQWNGIVWPASVEAEFNPTTGVDQATLATIGKASVAVPAGFEVHPKLHRHIKNRLKSIETERGIDWATAEAMAFGSLLLEGCDVRISGQDVGRGTFSQRHAMLVNQQTEGVIVPLNDELKAPGKLELANSSLSEMAVLGFEYGASWERPNLLPIWEAQFGDFFNGAQVIIDTYISSAETKWLKQSGIVLLLPHGLDGAGPEHSSSRIERMLQLSNDPYTPSPGNKSANVNMHVVFPTTPAQYFHLLRRQIKRNFRKPLIVAGPKGLLRLSAASSTLAELDQGSHFQPVLADPIADEAQVTRVILVSGKIYYDLIKEREARGFKDSVAFVRIEEISPFPFKELEEALRSYTNAREIFYLQEEPKNQGAYTHVASRIQPVLEAVAFEGALAYRGRKESALPAPGIGKLYSMQQKALINEAFEAL